MEVKEMKVMLLSMIIMNQLQAPQEAKAMTMTFEKALEFMSELETKIEEFKKIEEVDKEENKKQEK